MEDTIPVFSEELLKWFWALVTDAQAFPVTPVSSTLPLSRFWIHGSCAFYVGFDAFLLKISKLKMGVPSGFQKDSEKNSMDYRFRAPVYGSRREAP